MTSDEASLNLNEKLILRILLKAMVVKGDDRFKGIVVSRKRGVIEVQRAVGRRISRG